MSPSRQGVFRLQAVFLAIAVMLAAVPGRAWAKRPPSPKLLPDTTVALLAFPDVPELAERFMGTAMGRMTQDDQVKPLLTALYGSWLDSAAEFEEQIGLTLPELLAIPQGEVTVALVAPEDAAPTPVFMLDVGDQRSNARKLLDLAITLLDNSGASKVEQTVAGTKLLMYDGLGDDKKTRLILVEKDDTIVVGFDVAVMKQILESWNGGKGKTLSDNPDFAAIMQRCRGAKGHPAQAAYFVDPIAVMRAIGRQDTGARVALAMLPVLGLDGLNAVGGTVTLNTEQFDSIFHVHVLIDPPRTGILKAIGTKPGDSTPEDWVPADVTAYATLHWDLEKTYKEVSKLVDSFQYDGSVSQTLKQAFSDPTGIDVENKVLPALDGRITLIAELQRPVSQQSLSVLLAIKAKDTEVLDEVFKRMIVLAQGGLVKKSWAGKTYYEAQSPESDVPPESRQPVPCIGILDDYLILALRESIYQKIITTQSEGTNRLADAPEFKLIMDEIGRQSGGTDPAMVRFGRPEHAMHMLYDLATSDQARQDMRRQAENDPFVRTLNKALDENPLPPFAIIQQYLAPTGTVVIDDDTGWHFTNFTLKPQEE